ncbi:type 2 isopentenyl-diphosphate Delta-isomerase [Clostridium baratii]|uniref:type 2 isopentenyl-diphosphate Delta-isomerase n=1 Tax=Clostridium baratii TaxID=1561 RepID=UPI003D3378FA
MVDIDIIKKRKNDHIKYSLESYLDKDYFKDIKLFNNSIPEINYDDICLETKFLGKKIAMPVMINAMTGGSDESFKINNDLSKIASEFNIPIAVGSQSIMLKNKSVEKSFKIVRENNKEGIVISNLSALSSLDNVKRAVDSIEANAIQLHMNASQEFVMNEGDRDFKGMLKNIEHVINNINVPVILKEVGSGVSYDTCKLLSSIGAEYIDVSGKGGTSFIKVEDLRNGSNFYEELEQIEIKTPHSIIFCREANKNINIISSGGINKSSQVIKSLALGANITAIAGGILRNYIYGGREETKKYIIDLELNMKKLMGCLGCESIEDIKNLKYYYADEDNIKKYINY